MDACANTVKTQRDASGVQVLWSDTADTNSLCQSIATHSVNEEHALAITWFSPSRHQGADIVARLAALVSSLSSLHHNQTITGIAIGLPPKS